jgi:hypothetical protein
VNWYRLVGNAAAAAADDDDAQRTKLRCATRANKLMLGVRFLSVVVRGAWCLVVVVVLMMMVCCADCSYR